MVHDSSQANPNPIDILHRLEEAKMRGTISDHCYQVKKAQLLEHMDKAPQKRRKQRWGLVVVGVAVLAVVGMVVLVIVIR